MLNLYITGINSNVGKTYITAGLAATMQSLGYSTCVYKPIQTGAIEKSGFVQSPDLAFIKNIDPYIKTFSTYLLKQDITPILAAEYENTPIYPNLIKKDLSAIQKDFDCTIVEGTTGIMEPLAPKYLQSDLIKLLDLPIIIIIQPETDVINQTLLAINHATIKGLNIRGVIINNFPERTNNLDYKNIPRLIEEYSNTKILGILKSIPDTKKIIPSNLITDILNGIDIENLFKVKIAKLDI